MKMTGRRLVGLALRVATLVVCLAAAQGEAASAARLIADGISHLSAGRVDEARTAFEQAASLAERAGLPSLQGEAHRGLGRVRSYQRDFAGAAEEFSRARLLFEQAGDDHGTGAAWNELGTNALNQARHADAKSAYLHALDAFGRAQLPGEEANVLRNLAFLPNEPLDVRLAWISRAVDRARLDHSRLIEGLSLHTWGDLLFIAGDYVTARTKLDAALPILEAVGRGDQLPRLYTSIGRLYRVHGDPARALEFYQRALDRQRVLHDLAGQAQSLNAIALALHVMGQRQRAAASYDEALKTARAAGLESQIAFTLRQSGTFHVDAAEYERGITELRDGLVPGTAPADRIRAFASLARAYSALGRHADAEASATEAVTIASDSTEIDAKRVAFFGRARVRAAAGRPDDALVDLRDGLRMIEALRPNLIPIDPLKQGFAERLRGEFDFAVQLVSDLGHAEEAFVISEQGRSRAFLDLLASQDVNVAPADRAELASRVSAAAPALDRLTRTAQRLHSTVVSYWVMRDASFVWVMAPDGVVHMRKVRVTAARLADLVQRTRRPAAAVGGVRRGKEQTGASGADRIAAGPPSPAFRELYDLLIRPVRQWFPRADGPLVTIVPDGPLLQLPFAALRNERGRYLLEGYRLHYVPGLSVLEFTERRKLDPSEPRRTLLVANPTLPTAVASSERLAPIPGAVQEAQAIAQVLRGGAVQTLEGVDAGESRVRSGARDWTTLHFAAHGVVRDDRPLESFLALAGDSADPSNDGRLTVREIYGLNLRADLVVLSACRSGAGQVTRDGITGLTRAFLYAGAASVVASAWDLPDETAPRLFEAFYAARARGHDTSEALREAQLGILQALRAGTFQIDTPAGRFSVTEHPFVWAGVQIWGEP